MPVPVWQAPSPGQQPLAAHITQFLGTHQITWIPTGVQQAAQVTAGSGGVQSNSVYLAQSFTAGAAQSAVGYVMVHSSVTGGPAPWVLSVQADSGGAPSGTPLVSAPLPPVALPSGGWVAVALPAAGLVPGGAYWVVAAAAGDASDFFTWDKSNQPSGASTSVNGTVWTPAAYGLRYQVFDQSPVPPVAGTWEDNGARWTWQAYTSGLLTAVYGYTAGQAGGYTAYYRALAYAGDLPAGVT